MSDFVGFPTPSTHVSDHVQDARFKDPFGLKDICSVVLLLCTHIDGRDIIIAIILCSSK